MKHSTCRKSAFTLVEIIIVVAIIGLFTAIAVPNFVQARTPSQRTTCISNLRQIHSATQQWALEQNVGFAAPVTYTDIKPYLKSAIICPAGGTSFSNSYTLNGVTNLPTCNSTGGGATRGHVLPPDTGS